MIAAGPGVAVVPASAGDSTGIPGESCLRLKELYDCGMPLCFAWRTDNDSPTLANAIALVDETLSLEMGRG